MSVRRSHLVYAGFLIAIGVWGIAFAGEDASDFPYIPYDHAAIQYMSQTPDDAVTRLQRKIDSGAIKLAYDRTHGYLPSLLQHLGVNPDSQMLVFSKTSFQGPKISPQFPRAIYFSDDVAVGYVPQGDLMELTAIDPVHGVEFYTLDVTPKDKPRFLRRDMQCLQCHMIPGTLNVPGLEIASVIPASDGSQRFPGQGMIVDHRTPMEKRWGGWFVTGTAGRLQTRANAVAPSSDHPEAFDYEGTRNLTSLPARIDSARYPKQSSDIVALMTIEHQTRVTNLLIRLGWEARVADQENKTEEFRNGRLKMVVDQLANYMLFADEAKIADPIAGTSTFTKTFAQRGLRDKQGRSLRDFDLKTRLFRYPLSYMIYSDLFEALPASVREPLYQRLYDTLTGKIDSRLSAEDRRAILEIVRDTKSGLPAFWN